MARRYYKVYGDVGSVRPTQSDPFIAALVNGHLVEADRAVRHTAFVSQKEMKISMRQNKNNLAPLGEVQRRRLLDRHFYSKGSLKHKAFPGDLNHSGKGLVQAMGYQWFKGKGVAQVGWLSRSAVKYGKRWSEGGRKRLGVYDKKWGASELANARKNFPTLLYSYTNVPARPFMDKERRRQAPKIQKVFEARLLRNIGLMNNLEHKMELSSIINLGSAPMSASLKQRIKSQITV